MYFTSVKQWQITNVINWTIAGVIYWGIFRRHLTSDLKVSVTAEWSWKCRHRLQRQLLQIAAVRRVRRPTGLTHYFLPREHNARAILGAVILSVCPSHDKSKWRTAYILDTTRKGNHSATLTPTVVGGWVLLPSEICAQSDLLPCEKRRLRQFNVPLDT